MEGKFDEWSVLELFGHRRLAGKVSEAVVGGGSFLRIDIPRSGVTVTGVTVTDWTTQYYSPAAVFSITPTTEEVARAVARNNQPEPVFKWDLPHETPLTAGRWDLCSYRLKCDKAIQCLDCLVYINNSGGPPAGSERGEEYDEP